MTLKQKFMKIFECIMMLSIMAAPIWTFSLITVGIIGCIFETYAMEAYMIASFFIYLFIVAVIFLIATIEIIYEEIKNHYKEKRCNEIIKNI